MVFNELFNDAKFAERRSFHKALENAYKKFLERNGLVEGASILDLNTFEQLKSDFPSKLERLFILLFISEKNLTVESAIEEVKKLKITEKQWLSSDECPDPIGEIKKLAEHYEILPSSEQSFFTRYLKEIPEEIAFLKNKETYENELREFRADLQKLNDQFKTSPTTSEAFRLSTTEIIECMRKMLDTNIYRINKTNENHLLTRLLHTLSFAGYHDTLVSKNFESFGSKALEITKTPHNLSLEAKIEQVWKTLKKRGVPYTSQGSRINFSEKEWYNIVSGHAAYGLEGLVSHGQEEPNIQILPSHDQRKFPDNVPGSLYEEEYQLSCNQKVISCRSRIVYTCNPTLGFYVAPEYLAILQGMENRYFNYIEGDDYPYFFWNYANLQNFGSLVESYHATILMKLPDEFPLSSKGITVTQNSPFFVAPVDAFNKDYCEALRKELLHEKNFTLKNRWKKRGGLYYFHPKDRQHWEQAIPEILSLAYKTVDQKRSTHTEQELGAAFKELVNLGVMRYSQQLSLETLQSLTDRIKIQSIESRVCKSCIDRGGKTTAEHFIALSTPEEDNIALGAFHGRPLLVSRRLLLKEYTSAFYSLLKVVPRDVLKDYFGMIGQKISPNSSLSAFSIRVL